MRNKTILGIDNGLSGALSFYDGEELLIYDMPVIKIGKRNHYDLHGILKIIRTYDINHCYIEKLTPLPKIGGLQSFSMGYGEGLILGTLSSLMIPYTTIRPAQWKKEMSCPKEKNAARMRATQLFPQFSHNWDLKKHDGRAESALIALYGYNKNN